MIQLKCMVDHVSNSLILVSCTWTWFHLENFNHRYPLNYTISCILLVDCFVWCFFFCCGFLCHLTWWWVIHCLCRCRRIIFIVFFKCCRVKQNDDFLVYFPDKRTILPRGKDRRLRPSYFNLSYLLRVKNGSRFCSNIQSFGIRRFERWKNMHCTSLLWREILWHVRYCFCFVLL